MGKRWKGILAACCAAALIATAPGMTVLAAGMQEDSAYVFEGEEQEEATAIEEVMQEEAIPSFEEEEREEAAAIEEETQEEYSAEETPVSSSKRYTACFGALLPDIYSARLTTLPGK